MPPIPRDAAWDSSLALLAEGNTFISARCQRYQTDVFETRLMLRQALCVRGEDAARMFYEPDRFTRRGAMPLTTLLLLQDKGSVSTLDGTHFRHRKQMFLSLMTPESIDRLADLMTEHWLASLHKWRDRRRVVLHTAVERILCRAVCAWAGVPLPPTRVRQRTRELSAMVSGSGTIGLQTVWALLLRLRTERWLAGLVEQIRAGTIQVPAGSAAHVFAWHREPDGELLTPDIVAVELLNLVRPTVAVARFITFAALALHAHPDVRRRLERGDDQDLEPFVHEVRRFYPFAPMFGGRARVGFAWRGHHFAPGTWVILDLYGTNHDPRLWDEPAAFRPERFRAWDGSPYTLIPQGGGEHHVNHRCAGEWITIELMKRAARLLSTGMAYDVPPQDLRVDLSRFLPLPHSRFIISNVRPAAGAEPS